MDDPKAGLDDLKQIRSIMERSSTFLSLSGFSGLIIGCIGIVAAGIIGALCGNYMLTAEVLERVQSNGGLRHAVVAVLSVTFFCAVGTAFLFSLLKAKKNRLPLFNTISRSFAAHFLIPLCTGGLFIIVLFLRGRYELLLASMLVFYGLSLISASKFTLREIGYFGMSVIVIGLLALFFVSYSLLFWAAGFGLCTIGYGLYIYSKYER